MQANDTIGANDVIGSKQCIFNENEDYNFFVLR